MSQLGFIFKEMFFPNRDRHAIPPLDGAMRPNSELDDVETIARFDVPPVGLTSDGVGGVYCAVGNVIMKRNDAGLFEDFEGLDGEISALAADGQNGLVAGVVGKGVRYIGGSAAGTEWTHAGGKSILHPTAIGIAPDGSIWVAEGSQQNAPKDIIRDLLEHGNSGRIIKCSASGETKVITQGLAYPSGLVCQSDGSVLVTEAWKHRLLRFRDDGRAPEVVVPNFAGYPGHLSTGIDDGFLLCFFAMRTHLIEFLLEEDTYRKNMIDHVPPEYWVAPSLDCNETLLTPLQFGRIKVHGETKAWAPPRSYGLVAHFDSEAIATDSYHSRTNGETHGITSSCFANGELLATCHAQKSIVRILSGQKEGQNV
ncbi:hypothetical protein OO012_05160 [Rhodobacteraceae bacterium KMM 6894]|nr:hypothetical protein [Rhodobacteraceae bacterium KMM 6894]